MRNELKMGTTLSSQEALEANNSGASDEYKLTNMDVIHIQSILLGLHNSISELHNKQGELKKLISVQNNLFAQQNEIVKSLANVVSAIAKEGERENSEEESSHKDAHLSPPSAAVMPQLELTPADELSDESSVSDALLDTAIPVEGTPEKDCDGSNSSISSIPMPQQTHTKTQETQKVTGGKLSHGCADGLHRLFKLDVTVMIAKLNEHTLEETVTDLQNLLSRGRVGQASQYEMTLDAILQCIYDEPGRSSITARLIQKTSTKLTLDELLNLQKACTASLQKCMKMCDEIHDETESLRRSAFKADDKTRNELILSKFNAKCTQRNRWMHAVSRFALELFKANVLSSKPIIDLGDELLRNGFSGDDISATCFHSLFRKLNDISEVAVMEKQWIEKVYLSAEKLSENKKLSLATRLAFVELSELKNVRTEWK